MARGTRSPRKPKTPRQRIPLSPKAGGRHRDRRREASRRACRRGPVAREQDE